MCTDSLSYFSDVQVCSSPQPSGSKNMSTSTFVGIFSGTFEQRNLAASSLTRTISSATDSIDLPAFTNVSCADGTSFARDSILSSMIAASRLSISTVHRLSSLSCSKTTQNRKGPSAKCAFPTRYSPFIPSNNFCVRLCERPDIPTTPYHHCTYSSGIALFHVPSSARRKEV